VAPHGPASDPPARTLPHSKRTGNDPASAPVPACPATHSWLPRALVHPGRRIAPPPRRGPATTLLLSSHAE
jgi:hypothetical protein